MKGGFSSVIKPLWHIDIGEGWLGLENRKQKAHEVTVNMPRGARIRLGQNDGHRQGRGETLEGRRWAGVSVWGPVCRSQHLFGHTGRESEERCRAVASTLEKQNKSHSLLRCRKARVAWWIRQKWNTPRVLCTRTWKLKGSGLQMSFGKFLHLEYRRSKISKSSFVYLENN